MGDSCQPSLSFQPPFHGKIAISGCHLVYLTYFGMPGSFGQSLFPLERIPEFPFMVLPDMLLSCGGGDLPDLSTLAGAGHFTFFVPPGKLPSVDLIVNLIMSLTYSILIDD
jgi:hypothetical protein